jgi:uncharacterized protein YjbI with pentapeptide repeats
MLMDVADRNRVSIPTDDSVLDSQSLTLNDQYFPSRVPPKAVLYYLQNREGLTMAAEEHLQIIRQGVSAWNEWRKKNPELIPDLRRAYLIGADLRNADLRGADLSGASLRGTDLSGANLIEADLRTADLRKADLRGADLRESSLFEANLTEANLIGANLANLSLLKTYLNGANLSRATLTDSTLFGAMLFNANLEGANLNGADLSVAHLNGANLRGAKLILSDLSQAELVGADLTGAKLYGADLRWTDLSKAILNEADLGGTLLLKTNLSGASLLGSHVYGASVWDIKVDDQTNQHNIIITPEDQADITVDNIEVAQLIYLLLNNQSIRGVINTITSKAVLILGRFSEDRKPILDAIRDELRKHNYLPMMFDFDPTTNQTITETVKTLARMSRFVIADITDARRVPQELQIIDTHCRTVAVRLIKKRGEPEYGMLDFRNSPWFVKGRCEYENAEELIASIKENVIGPTEAKVQELRKAS